MKVTGMVHVCVDMRIGEIWFGVIACMSVCVDWMLDIKNREC